MKTKKKMYSLSNIRLKNYLDEYYITGKKSLPTIADELGVSVGGLKNFMYRHNINKKDYYIKRDKEIYSLYKDGNKQTLIAKHYNLTLQQVSNIIRSFVG